MSPFFISYIKKQYRCKDCVANAREGYRCCDKHLKAARDHWRRWAKVRRAAGLCLSCDRRGLIARGLVNKRGFRIGKMAKGKRLLRCEEHTIENREKCALWSAAHPDYSKLQWERSKALLAAGVCICAAHNRLGGGFRRCESCRKRKSK